MRADLKDILARHPAPWTLGEEHESMCRVHDANRHYVFSVHTLGFRFGIDPHTLAETICAFIAQASEEGEAETPPSPS